eukprot:TRINITY_DN16718_c0_g1_i1.p1 TRINITY_DN16718_c0_g1~~TRINITY_DN16718_c0_g1_i1.p1  ORF type:complete len:439 (+),score=91.84 TRINITY_DN16718_c0_g1_i1:100-1416(+)
MSDGFYADARGILENRSRGISPVRDPMMTMPLGADGFVIAPPRSSHALTSDMVDGFTMPAQTWTAPSSSKLGDDAAGVSTTGGAVVGLRDRFIREAKNERQRCLDVAEAAERRRAELRGVSHAATQTDAVFIIDGPGPTEGSEALVNAPRRSGGTTPTTGGGGGNEVWGNSDDKEQAEALRTIQMLGACGSESRQHKELVSNLESMLRRERMSREELESELSSEKKATESSKQQVLCLEYELDGKEAALQVAERALESRDDEMLDANVKIQNLQDEIASRQAREAAAKEVARDTVAEDSRMQVLRRLLAERDQQLEQKDQNIRRLISAVRQHAAAGVFGANSFIIENAAARLAPTRSEESTVCESAQFADDESRYRFEDGGDYGDQAFTEQRGYSDHPGYADQHGYVNHGFDDVEGHLVQGDMRADMGMAPVHSNSQW